MIVATIKHIVAIVAVGGALSIMLFLGAKVLVGQEQYECQKWQAEAKQYQNYYVTGWQAAQCAHYNIKIEAPVENN